MIPYDCVIFCMCCILFLIFEWFWLFCVLVYDLHLFVWLCLWLVCVFCKILYGFVWWCMSYICCFLWFWMTLCSIVYDFGWLLSLCLISYFVWFDIYDVVWLCMVSYGCVWCCMILNYLLIVCVKVSMVINSFLILIMLYDLY